MDWQVKDRTTHALVAEFTTRADAVAYVDSLAGKDSVLAGCFRVVSVRDQASEEAQRQAANVGAFDEDADGSVGRLSEWLEIGRQIAGRYSN